MQSVDGGIKMYVPINEENFNCMFPSVLTVKMNYMGNLVKVFTLENGKGGALKTSLTTNEMKD